MAAAGLPAVAATWKDKSLQIDPGRLDASQRQRLQAVLDALNPVYMNALQGSKARIRRRSRRCRSACRLSSGAINPGWYWTTEPASWSAARTALIG